MRTTWAVALAALVAFAGASASPQMEEGDPGLVPPSQLSVSQHEIIGAPSDCPSINAMSMIWDGGTIGLGRAASVKLKDAAQFSIAPGHVPATGTFGGTVRFDVMSAANYRVGLSPGVWIDVVSKKKPISSIGHEHRSACKTVDFRLVPGSYAIQLSGSTSPSIDLKITRLG